MSVRRVVTGMTADGRSLVVGDCAVPQLDIDIPGFAVVPLWHTDASSPAPGAAPSAMVPSGDPQPGQTTVLWSMFGPGDAPRSMHASPTIDHVYVVSGEICLLVDGGQEVPLSANDFLVQQGARHTWVNRSTEPACLLIFRVGAESSTTTEVVS